MSGWLENIFDSIKHLNNFVDKYKKDTVIQSLPTLTFVNRAKKMIEQGDFVEAEDILKKALELPQKDALVYKYLGLVYEKTGRNELAVESYQNSAEINPQDKNIWQRLGFSLISTGKFEQAEKAFENSDKIQCGVSETYTGWGMALMKQEKFSGAREKFAKASKMNKYNFSAMFLCAVVEIKLEMYDKAEEKLAFLTKVYPNEGNTFEYARLKAIKNDYADAIFYAKKALEFNSNMLPAYILLGQLYSAKYDKENALKMFELAFGKDLISQALYLEWGKALQKFEMYDDALEKFQKAFELDPENIDAMASLGFCYAINKQLDKAEPLLQKAIEKDPENKKVKQALGIIAYKNGDIDKAISILKSNDENEISCYYLAKCFEYQGNDIRTVDYYEACLRLNDSFMTAYLDYVNYLISKNEFADAKRKLRKALKIDENNIVLLNLMFYVSYILVKDNVCEYNVKETLEIAEKIENINPDLFEYPMQKQELINILPERD